MQLYGDINRLQCQTLYRSIEIRAMVYTHTILSQCPHKKALAPDIDEIKAKISVKLKKLSAICKGIDKQEWDIYSRNAKDIEKDKKLS